MVSSINRLICIVIQIPNPNIFFKETQSNESESGCSSTVMGRKKRLSLPSIFPTRQSISQSQERKVLHTCHKISRAKSSLVNDPSKNFSGEFNFITSKHLLRNSQGEIYSHVQEGQLRLVAWTIWGSIYLHQVYLNNLLSLYQLKEEKILPLISNWSGESFVPGALSR